MLTVSTKAATTAITTREAVKTELGLSSNAEDAYIDSKILQVTDEICDYLSIKRAADGTRNLGQEVLVETFLSERQGRSFSLLDQSYGMGLSGNDRRPSLILARWPVFSIGSVVEGTTTLDPATQYQVNEAGILLRLSSGCKIHWGHCPVTVTYTAGWLLPGDQNRNLPHSIEAAAIDYIKALRFSRKRDPLVKAQNVSGVLDTDYWVGTIGEEGSIPPNVASRLERYRRVSIG